MKIIKFATIIFSLLSVFNVSASDFESGKIYRFNNVAKPGYCMSLSNSTLGAVGATLQPNDPKQQWYLTANADNTGFYFRNVANGAYLSSPNALYTQWQLVFTETPDDSSMLFSILPYEDNWVIRPTHNTGAYSHAHNDAYNNIVSWVNSSVGSQWTWDEILKTPEELQEILDNFHSTGDEIANEAKYGANLNALFHDRACTELKVSGDLSANSDYNSLSPVLRKMVDKVNQGDWSENTGDWDNDHALKYRVQLYEPFSEGASAASFAGIQAYTNMNNPTGVLADAGDLLYVMVNDEIKDGSTLYIQGIPDTGMHNSATTGYKLHQGLNIIYCNDDNTHFFIYFTVNTVDGKQRIRRLEDYEPIKIHIEGGRLNGFFNYVGDELYKPDTREDFLYTSSRATHPMYDLIGKYVILHFFLEDTADTPQSTTLQHGVKSCFDPEKNPGATKQYDPVVTMKAWDDMCFSERILMGIQSDKDVENPFNKGFYSSILNDKVKGGEYEINLTEPYSDYFNNRMMGITLQAAGLYMNATSWRTAYAPGTMSAILTQFPQDGIWGPAHEYGHINQTPMRIAGTTEESNNVFSNVANYYLCQTTSRCNYPSDQLNIFNEGKTYLEHGTWGTTRMFWQLWCYYHAAGKNTKFYPRLYELLRNYPLKRDLTSIPGKLNPKTDMLHFAKMCCVAAQEDLTDFFTSWGFFVPQNDYHIDDYDVYDCVLTQEDIDEVKEEIKAFGFPKNNAIILIDDRVDSPLPAGFGYRKELAGDLGGISDFEDNRKASGNLIYNIEGSDIRITGSGDAGVGFLIYDTAGGLIGFSNSYSFPLSSEAAAALEEGKAMVYAIGADNQKKEILTESAGVPVTEIQSFDGMKPVDVYDISGRIIRHRMNLQDVETLQPGLYIIRQDKISKKLILSGGKN